MSANELASVCISSGLTEAQGGSGDKEGSGRRIDGEETEGDGEGQV